MMYSLERPIDTVISYLLKSTTSHYPYTNMVQHQHADSAAVEEKIGAIEIEKVATRDDVNLESVVDEAVGEEQLKIEKRAT